MKKRDLILLSALLILALGLYLMTLRSQEGSTVTVRVSGKTVLERPLAMSGRYEIPLEDGQKNVIRIENGAVYMEEANCRDQLCVHQGKIRNRAKNIVCLPHNLVVSLETGRTGGEQDDLDVIIY